MEVSLLSLLIGSSDWEELSDDDEAAMKMQQRFSMLLDERAFDWPKSPIEL